LQLLFKQSYFNLELNNFIVQILIVAKTNINKIYNKIYNKIFLLYFQVLEIEMRRFSNNYYKKKIIIQYLLQNRVDINKIILNNNFVLNFIYKLFNKYYKIILIEILLQENIDFNILNCKD